MSTKIVINDKYSCAIEMEKHDERIRNTKMRMCLWLNKCPADEEDELIDCDQCPASLCNEGKTLDETLAIFNNKCNVEVING